MTSSLVVAADSGVFGSCQRDGETCGSGEVAAGGDPDDCGDLRDAVDGLGRDDQDTAIFRRASFREVLDLLAYYRAILCRDSCGGL